MLFAALDYRTYRLRIGRYGDGPRTKTPLLGFLGGVPDDVVEQLEIGDLIFTQKLDSVWSWGVMYFGSSPVDHVAIYMGNGRISHVTLSGYRNHSIKVFGKSTIILPARPDIETARLLQREGPSEQPNPPESDLLDEGNESDRKLRWYHILPPKGQLVWVMVGIILAFYPERFRVKFLADLVLACLFFDAILWIFSGQLGATYLAAACSLISLINMLIFRFRMWRGARLSESSHPGIAYRWFMRVGGIMFTPIGPLFLLGPILLPMRAIETICRNRGEGTDHSADYYFEKARELFYGGHEDGNIEPGSDQAERDQRNQDQHQ